MTPEEKEFHETSNGLEQAKREIYGAIHALDQVPHDLRGRRDGIKNILKNALELLLNEQNQLSPASTRENIGSVMKPAAYELEALRHALREWGFSLQAIDHEQE